MEDNDSDNYLLGSANRRLLFSSQLSQGIDTSQRGNALTNESSIDKSLDIRLLSQIDFLTPAVSCRDLCLTISSRKRFPRKYLTLLKTLLTILGSLARRHRRNIPLERGLFLSVKSVMVPIAIFDFIQDAQQSEVKKNCLFPLERMAVATLQAPEENPYLILPDDILLNLRKLLQKPDFTVLDESRITRYQRDFKELQVSPCFGDHF